ncbi:hypothetical protein F5148DRAFT_1330840 [Russula earlei]|uniref:Uncharacterized protein n=1 Tax=Russula earlei TaxID=71964 RepID=A0ACC0TXJ1_9AGAM|nr:hypothetical protein F5148DRAFT_1330840 [Russula earlei]
MDLIRSLLSSVQAGIHKILSQCSSCCNYVNISKSHRISWSGIFLMAISEMGLANEYKYKSQCLQFQFPPAALLFVSYLVRVTNSFSTLHRASSTARLLNDFHDFYFESTLPLTPTMLTSGAIAFFCLAVGVAPSFAVPLMLARSKQNPYPPSHLRMGRPGKVSGKNTQAQPTTTAASRTTNSSPLRYQVFPTSAARFDREMRPPGDHLQQSEGPLGSPQRPLLFDEAPNVRKSDGADPTIWPGPGYKPF